jgi:hypothetical protein
MARSCFRAVSLPIALLPREIPSSIQTRRSTLALVTDGMNALKASEAGRMYFDPLALGGTTQHQDEQHSERTEGCCQYQEAVVP